MRYKILILILMVFIRAIFSAADTAFTYVNKAKISQLSKKERKAKKIKAMLENKTRTYGVIELGITLIELFATAFAAEVFVKDLTNILYDTFVISYETATIISIVLITIILSYILLIFGTVLPKRIARNNPEKTAYRVINVVYFASILNHPFEKLVEVSIKIFSKIFGISDNKKEKLTEKEIKMIIAEGKDQGLIDKLEKEILFNALKFESILVKDIMIPKEKIAFINHDYTKEELLQKIKKYAYTRMPVYKGNKDNIIGIFNVKDLIIEYSKTSEIEIDLDKNIRSVMLINKQEKISTAFKLMQANNQAILMVVDDNKKTVGLITIEDVIEKLVGKIFDEYDK